MAHHTLLVLLAQEVPPFNPVAVAIDLLLGIAKIFFGGSPDLSALVGAVNNTWANVVVGTAFLYNAVGFITDFLKKLLGTIADGLKHIITDILHGHLKAVLEDIQKLLHALHDLFAPLIAILRKLQAIQRSQQLQAMRRVINLIQRARQILLVFRILHIKIATKLDNFLAGIEGRLISRELQLASKTNEIIGWINLVVDPFGALRGTTVFGPIGRLLAALAGAARAVDLQKVFPQLASRPGPNGSTVAWQHFADDYAATTPTQLGAYGDFHRGVLQGLEILKREYNA